jgi:hypothetical protein
MRTMAVSPKSMFTPAAVEGRGIIGKACRIHGGSRCADAQGARAEKTLRVLNSDRYDLRSKYFLYALTHIQSLFSQNRYTLT